MVGGAWLATRGGWRGVRRSGAFALLDALVAAVIMGVALSAIIGLSSQAINSQRLGEQIATAAMMADEQLNLVLARGPDGYAKSYPVEGACDAPFGAYRYKLDFSGGSGGTPYRVRCTILWDAATSATPQSIVVDTLVAARTGDDPDPDRKPATPPERPQ